MSEAVRVHPVASPERTAAERIERTLACAILRGDLKPGIRLPPVRALAEEYEVTVPTIQRALDRLGSMDLVTAKRGSGVTVENPRRNMNLSLIPLWFEALSDQPKKAAKILADFLSLRRLITLHLFKTAGAELEASLPQLLPLALKLGAATELAEIARADAELTRLVVERVDNFALQAVFQTVEKMALEVPHMAEALYSDRKAHQAVLEQVVTSFGLSDRREASRALHAAFEEWDAKTVQKYAELLTRAQSEPST